MARVAISEFKAKTIVYSKMNIKYNGLALKSTDDLKHKISKLGNEQTYVIKVDQGIKKRQKSGLLFKDVYKKDIPKKAKILFSKGYSQLLIEQFIPHELEEEKYLSLERTREGVVINYSKFGGVEIENNSDKIKKDILNKDTSLKINNFFNFGENILEIFLKTFESENFSFLEINPFIINDDMIILIDLAVEVDSTASFLKDISWSENDLVSPETTSSQEELAIKKLAETSPSSFKLKMLNPNGSIFTIFSGGGASIVLADEIGKRGGAHNLADYAEYSGNPNEDETYIFVKNILSLLVKSKANKKILYIAGSVANFTDIRTTFKGVIKGIDEKRGELQKQNIKVYVRRGGPYQEEGLKMMERYLRKNEILGKVAGPETILTDIIIKT